MPDILASIRLKSDRQLAKHDHHTRNPPCQLRSRVFGARVSGLRTISVAQSVRRRVQGAEGGTYSSAKPDESEDCVSVTKHRDGRLMGRAQSGRDFDTIDGGQERYRLGILQCRLAPRECEDGIIQRI